MSGKGGHASICGGGSAPLALGRTLGPEEPPLARDRKLVRPAALSCAFCWPPSGPCTQRETTNLHTGQMPTRSSSKKTRNCRHRKLVKPTVGLRDRNCSMLGMPH